MSSVEKMPSQPRLSLPANDGKILIIGGYGQVGRAIAERLAPVFPGRVTIAGRNLSKAKMAAAEVGHGAQGCAVDAFAADAGDTLHDVALVLMCLDQTDTRFVAPCLSRGIHYVDISANHAFLSQIDALDGIAKASGVAAVLSVGTAPGLTNLLAARAKAMMERLDRIDILIEFGLGDRHGQAAVEWMFDNLDATYDVRENGTARRVQSFGDSFALLLPGQDGKRAAYRFNFSDQHVIGRTLAVPSVSTWVRFENRLSTWLFAVSIRAGLGRLMRRTFWRKVGVWLFMHVHIGSDICGVAVQARGLARDGSQEVTIGVVGRNEARMTAIVAAETTRQVLTASPGSGVFHSEEAIALAPVIAALRNEYPDLVVAL